MPSITGNLINRRDYDMLREWLHDFYWYHPHRKMSHDQVAIRASRDLEMNVKASQIARQKAKLAKTWNEED